MLLYDFDKRNGISKYEYLYRCLKEDIVTGRIVQGSRMPSKRTLAEENGISIRTVLNAYDQLVVEGYLVSKERSGYYVASDFDSPFRYQKINIPLPAPEEDEDWLADFTTNTSVYEKFPFSIWSKVIRQVLGDYHNQLAKRGDFLGSPRLRQEIANYLYQNRNILVSPDCIVIGTGIEYLYYKLIALLPENAIYTVENPGYKKIRMIFKDQHVNWVSTSMDENGINMKSLRDCKATVVHTSPEHHYPLGTVMSARRRQELLAWLSESEDHYIIEDDYDCEFRYHGHTISALYGMDQNRRVIYMNTFSKTMTPGLRISYMILPPDLLEKYVRTANFYSNTSSNLEQEALARFIHDGYFEKHLNRMRKYYLQQGTILKSALLDTPSIPIVEISGINTGTHLLVKVNTTLTDKEIKKRAAVLKINLCCLSEFCTQKKHQYAHTLVLNYSSMAEEQIQKVAALMGKIFIVK